MAFDQSLYNVDEDDGPAQPVLVLSNPSSMDFTVQVINIDGSATGEYYSDLLLILRVHKGSVL